MALFHLDDLRRSKRRLLSVLILLPFAGCAGEGIVDPTAPAPLCTDVAPFRPELHCIQEFVFTPQCAYSGCHANPASLGLDLYKGQTYMHTVGVASYWEPSLARIDPGDPDASYLIRKIRGDASIVGSQMPPGGYLTQEEIDVIVQWVLNGAEDN